MVAWNSDSNLVPDLPVARMHLAVFGRKLYDGRSQPQVVDLGKSAARLGKADGELLGREAGDTVWGIECLPLDASQ